MTTLDPSHFPWRAHDNDPSTGGAVHTSVRAPFASTSASGSPRRRGAAAARYASSSDLESSSDDIDADEHAEHYAALKRRRRVRKLNKRCAQVIRREKSERADDDNHDNADDLGAPARLDHEDARAHGRIPTIPVPDVRFEQSYLMSIQPFITSHPVQSASKSSDTDEKYHSDTTQQTPSKQARKDKRRRVEESLALVDDPASRKGSPLDDLLHPSSDRRVSIQWSQIAYITIRDQVFSPLIQGALWAFGGILLSSMWAGWNGKSALASKGKSSSSTSGLRSYLSRLVGPALAGTHSGPRHS